MTRAAESLNISQPSVFKQVKSLEEFCGVRLYRKVGRQIELTREGQRVQAEVREILLRIEWLGQRFRGRRRRSTAAVIPSLIRKQPSAIIFRTKCSRGIEELVLQSQVDIGAITKPSNSRLLRLLPCRPL